MTAHTDDTELQNLAKAFALWPKCSVPGASFGQLVDVQLLSPSQKEEIIHTAIGIEG